MNASERAKIPAEALPVRYSGEKDGSTTVSSLFDFI